MTNKTDNGRWWAPLFAVLILIAWAWFAGGSGGFEQTPKAPIIFLHILTWLILGALVYLYSQDASANIRVDVSAIIIGLIILVVIWYLPTWVPDAKAKLSEFGFNLDLQKSPLVLWVAMAFLLGYYRRMTLKIREVVINYAKKNLGIMEEEDQKGNANHRFSVFLNGLSQILGFSEPE